MLKACSRCGKIHPYGQCSIPVKRVRDYGREYKGKDERTEEQKFRSTSQWQRKRIQILQRDLYVCRLCLMNHVINHNDLQVHHIVKIRDNNDMKLEDSNLITLCKYCHDVVEKDKNYQTILRQLAESPPYQGILK